MNIFPKFNQTTTCAICGKNTQGQSALIPIDDTGDGKIFECLQVHLDCLDLKVMKTMVDEDGYIFYQMVEKK